MFGFNFQETDLVLSRTMSSIAPDPVLEIRLDTQEAETGLWVRNPLFPSPHSSQLLVPAEVAAAGTEGMRTERAEVTGVLISPRTLFRKAVEVVPRTGATEARLIAEATSLKDRIRGLEQTVNSNESASLIQEIRRLERENEMFREKLRSNQANRTNLEREMAEMRTVNAFLTAQLKAESSQVEQLKAQLNIEEMEGLCREVDSLRLDNEGMRTRINCLSSELFSAKEHIKFLEIELLETEASRIAENRMREGQIAAAQAAKQTSQRATLQAATMQLSQAVARLFDPSKMAAEVAALERKRAEVSPRQCVERMQKQAEWREKAAFELEILLIDSSISTAKSRLKRSEAGG